MTAISAAAVKEAVLGPEVARLSGAQRTGVSLTQAEVAALAPVSVYGGKMLEVSALVENVAVREQCASLLCAWDVHVARLPNAPAIHGVQIRCAGREINLSLREGDLLDRLGVDNAIRYATVPAVDRFMRLRLAEVMDHESPALQRLGSHRIELPTRVAVAVPSDQASSFLKELEKESDSLDGQVSRQWFYARRIDYLVGEQYIPGRVVDLPICGGISSVVFKRNLGVEVDSRDSARVVKDVFLVISIAALPAAPVTGSVAMGGWIAANATFGAITEGTATYVSSRDAQAATLSAAKGALLGAVSGAVGIAAKGLIAPAISNDLLAATASGATVGSVTAGSDAVIRVVERGDDVSAAAKEVATAAVVGAVGGGVIGGGMHIVSKAVNTLCTQLSEGRAAGDAAGSKRFEEYRDLIEPQAADAGVLHMGDVRVRSRQLDARLDDFASYLKETDPQFGKHVDSMRQRIAEAVASKDVARVSQLEKQIRTGLSGEFAEARVKEVFRPYFHTCTVQKRVQDGATVIDMVFADAKRPIAIKGLGLVEKGGSLPVEVKAASADYFQREIKSGHLLRQLDGHKEFGKGLVVTTRDVNEAFLGPGGGRDLIKQKDAAVYRLLPLKAEIDAAMNRLVVGTSQVT
jgi:hypothetical protein